MSSSTAIELRQAAGTTSAPRQSRPRHETNAGDGDDDDVLLASRLADSTVPDGGYGWVIVAGGAVLLWWALGTIYAWGVIQTALVQDGLSDPAVLSFVGGLCAAFISALGIANARIIRKLGARWTGMLGVALMGGSEVLSGFAVSNLGALFFTSGVLMGLGVSLVSTVVFTVPSQYFSSKRGLANGLIFAGSGFGGAAISFGLEALIRTLGTAWAYRVLGVVTLATGLPAAWLIRERVALSALPSAVEWSLFKSGTFVFVFLAGAIGTFPLFVPPFFLPLYSKSLGLSSGAGAGLVAGFSLASAVGRIVSGIACDKFGSLNTWMASQLITALSMFIIWPASTSLAPLVAFVIINGAANGAFFSTSPTVVSNTFGSARVTVAMGMVITGFLGGYLLGAPIAGYLLEAYGGSEVGLQAYRPAMYYAGSLALVSAGMVLGARTSRTRSLLARI